MRKPAIISDLGKIITGNTPPRNNPELYGSHTPFIKATDISEDEKYTYNPEEYYSEEGYNKYHRSLIPKGATCVVTIGSIGRKMTMAHCDCFINQAMNAIIPYPDYDKEYVYYLVRNSLRNLKALDSGTASGRENVSKSAFSNMEIEIETDYNIQHAIGATLSDYDNLIDSNRQQIKLLEEAAQRLYRDWFINFRFPGHESTRIIDGLPEGWEICVISKVAHINNHTLPKDYAFENIKYVDLGSVTKGRIKNYSCYELNKAPGRARRIAVHGNIIWGMVRPINRNYALVLNPTQDTVFSTGFAILEAFNVPFEYLYLYVTQDKFVGYLDGIANGSAYPSVKPEHFEMANILIPSQNVLNEFRAYTAEIFEKIYTLNTQIERLSEARDLLLPRLMSGELTI